MKKFQKINNNIKSKSKSNINMDQLKNELSKLILYKQFNPIIKLFESNGFVLIVADASATLEKQLHVLQGEITVLQTQIINIGSIGLTGPAGTMGLTGP